MCRQDRHRSYADAQGKGHVTVDKIVLEQQKRMVKAQLDKVKPEAKNASTDAAS